MSGAGEQIDFSEFVGEAAVHFEEHLRDGGCLWGEFIFTGIAVVLNEIVFEGEPHEANEGV